MLSVAFAVAALLHAACAQTCLFVGLSGTCVPPADCRDAVSVSTRDGAAGCESAEASQFSFRLVVRDVLLLTHQSGSRSVLLRRAGLQRDCGWLGAARRRCLRVVGDELRARRI